ncbi:hypothetical protein SAMN05421743_108122 [Thalassobacillus cyri]|uniref:Uncharacterized protein n=1 Tax=Thalassobacillus cyri TaxID=571932 RepID=A0A1H4E3R2_9BACI|nr:hypothetical protein [Thalassobacillus cyri]SEA79546.1 hypothetical protein SAMN05421743_108122 [Thalassobacillus cyri]
MKLDIKPYHSMGPIKLGMSRKEVRETLNLKVTEFMKDEADENTTDAFDDLGINVYYKADDTCEMIEVSSSAIPMLKHKKLIGPPLKQVKEMLRSYDPYIYLVGDILISDRLGISLYTEDVEDDELPVEAVMLFEKGYDDELQELLAQLEEED